MSPTNRAWPYTPLTVVRRGEAILALTAAEIIAMGTTSVVLLTAPGAGKAIVVESIIVEFVAGNVAFTGGGAVSIMYTGGATVHQGSIPASVIQGAVNANLALSPADAANGLAVLANTAIEITNATAAFAAGNGTMTIVLKYRTVPAN